MAVALSDRIAFTAREAAVAANVRRARLDRAIRDLELPVHKIEGTSRTLILRRDLEAWLESFPPPEPRPAALKSEQPATDGDDHAE